MKTHAIQLLLLKLRVQNSLPSVSSKFVDSLTVLPFPHPNKPEKNFSPIFYRLTLSSRKIINCQIKIVAQLYEIRGKNLIRPFQVLHLKRKIFATLTKTCGAYEIQMSFENGKNANNECKLLCQCLNTTPSHPTLNTTCASPFCATPPLPRLNWSPSYCNYKIIFPFFPHPSTHTFPH